MPNVMAAMPNIGGALCSTPQSLADADYRVLCSKATNTRNLLTLAGVPQTNEMISAASRPKFTIFWGHMAFTLVADVPSRRRLRSASADQLLVPSYQRSTIGRRAFPIAGARVWNALPSHVTSAPSLAVFGRCLKTELFRRYYNAV